MIHLNAALATFALGFGLISFSTAQAAPMNYNEQINGDLTPSGALPILAFDVGLNTVTGNLGFTQPGPTDYDSFAFSIPANTQLVGANVTLTDNLGNISQSKWEFYSGSNAYLGGTLLETVISLSPGATVFATPPLGSNIYNLSHISFGFFVGNDENTTDYVFSFRVDAIPEPSTAVFAAMALCGLTFVTPRKRNRKA